MTAVRISERRKNGKDSRRWFGGLILVILALLLLVLRGWPSSAASGPEAMRLLRGDDLRALTLDTEGDRRLLDHLRRRRGPVSTSRSLPPAADVLYVTLRIEELERTEGWPLGLAATQSAANDVVPEDAAAAYKALGQAEAAGIMNLLQPLVAQERQLWQAYREAAGSVPQPAGRGFGKLAQRLDALLSAIRASRRQWLAAHLDEIAGP